MLDRAVLTLFFFTLKQITSITTTIFIWTLCNGKLTLAIHTSLTTDTQLIS